MANQDVKAALAAVKAKEKASKAKAKEVKAAERARKKSSTNPADMNRFRQIAYAYKLTHEYDKPLPWLLLAAFLLPVVICVVLGIVFHIVAMLTITGVLTGVLLAMLVLVRRAKQATFKRYAGQAGSAEVALQMLPKQWVSPPTVIAVTRQKDAIHRTIGPGGIVLVGEGDPGRLKQLLTSEVKKHEKVAFGVAVTTVIMGEKAGQVPLSGLAEHIRKLPKVLQPHQITDVKARLRALDAVRPQLPMPKGPIPTSPRQIRTSRQAMRGR